jgi:two-component system, OmpR family, response regulator QseB
VRLEAATMKRILLIEDDKTVADLITMILGDVGYAVDWAPNTTEGTRSLDASRPDLILLDSTLRGASGAAFLRMCKCDLTLAHIPIVAMVGPLRSMPPGEPTPDGAIQKPFDIDELSSTVRQCIGDEAMVADGVLA